MKMTEPIDRSGVALRGSLRLNEPMAKHVSWRAGGVAGRAYVPADRADLAAFLTTLPKGEPIYFVGLGSNLLVRDGGFHGTVEQIASKSHEVDRFALGKRSEEHTSELQSR